MKYLVIESELGLGNRLFSLATWNVLAKETHRQLRILWPKDNNVCNTGFNDIFKNHNFVIEKDELLKKIRKKSYIKLQINIGIIGNNDENDMKMINNIMNIEQDIIIVSLSCYFEPDFVSLVDFYKSTRNFLKTLCLKSSIKDKIECFTKKHGIHPDNPRMFGIHIRRTDRISSIRVSTNEHFVKVITNEIKCYGAVIFFLATDSIQDQQYFVKRYPNNIIVYDKKYNLQNRYRPCTLEDAVIELYILSNTFPRFRLLG